MNQRTLLTALAAVALLALAAVAFHATGTLNIFGAATQQARDASRNTPTVDEFADPDDPTANIKFDGRDEHGRYINGPDGKRIYVDEKGRRYIRNPDGTRSYVNEYGEPVDRHGRPIKPGESDGDGRSGPDGRPGEGTGDNPDESTNTEEETKPATLTGSVVDDAGNPYAGATVTAQVGSQAVKTTSGEEGGFSLSLPAEQPVTLTAADAYGNTSKAVTTKLAPAGTTLKQPLVLPRDTAIRGVVRDLDTGLPIEGAQVLLMEGVTHAFSVKHSQAADSGGAFAFGKLTPAAYRLQISRDGYAPRILNSVEPPANLIVEMSAGAVITGTIKDTDGDPIAGAVVSCDFNSEPAQKFHTEAIADEAGLYIVKCQPESQHNTISVLAPGFVTGKKTFVRSGSENVNFELKPSGNMVLHGRILTPSGTAVTAATFSCTFETGVNSSVLQAVGPDAGGVFRCEVHNITVELQIKTAGFALARVPITPTPGDEIDLGDIYLKPGVAIFGQVRQAGQDTPIVGATVRVDEISTLTDNDGRYRLEGLPEQPEYLVVAAHAAFANRGVTIPREGNEQELEVNVALSVGSFEVVVLTVVQGSNEPIAGVKVTATVYSQTVTTGAGGRAHLIGLGSSWVDVRVEKAGYATVETHVTADIPQGETKVPEHVIALTPGSTISGVCTSEGEPLPGATKVEIWNTTKLVATLQTDTEGAYTSEALPLGQYFVGLPDYHVAAQAVTLAEEELTHDFEIGKVCHLRGKLIRADGQPHSNAGVYIYRRDEVYWSATIHTGPDGKYEVTNLFPGEWVFCALKTQGDTAAQFAVKVSVSNAGWNDKDVQLPAITGTITGRVTYPDGQPVKKARVSVTNLTADFPRALLAAYVVTNDDGYYTAERLENGSQMQARVGGYQDEAQTGTAFSEVVTIPSDNSPVEANIVVAPSGVTVRVAMRRADGGPIMTGGPLSYLYDAQGRLSGLYFGGGTYVGHIDLYDVVPGTYTLVVTNHGMKKASLQITVSSEPITTGLEILVEPHDRSSE